MKARTLNASGVMLNALTPLLAIATSLLLLAGCSAANDSEQSAAMNDSAPSASEADPDQQVESEELQENDSLPEELVRAYLDVLQENKSAIRAYDWQREATPDYEPMKKQTALCDINGDNMPELFFFTSQQPSTAFLKIYSLNGKNAEEIEYRCSNNVTYPTDDPSFGFCDANAASGTTYVVAKSSDGNRFFIYSTIGDITLFYRMNVYEANDDGTVEEISSLTCDYDIKTEKAECTENGKPVTLKAFETETEKYLDGIDKVILYSGNDSEAITSKTGNPSEAPDAFLSKSYDDMVRYLKSQLPTEGPSEGVEEGFSFEDVAGMYSGPASNVKINADGTYTCGTGVRNEGGGTITYLGQEGNHHNLELVGDFGGTYKLYVNASAEDIADDIPYLSPSYPTNLLYDDASDFYLAMK